MDTLLDPPAAANPAQLRATRALALPRSMLNRLLRSWNAGLDLIWNPPAPTTTAQVLAALGGQGAALFTRSAALRAFLEAQKPGCTATASAARIKAVTLNADGTVTLASSSP